MAILAIIGAGHAIQAILFQPLFAMIAFETGVDHAANRNPVALGKAGDIFANRPDMTDNLVARNDRISAAAPVIARCVQVRMANAAMRYFNQDIVVAQAPAVEREGFQRLVRRMGGIAFGGIFVGLRIGHVGAFYTNRVPAGEPEP